MQLDQLLQQCGKLKESYESFIYYLNLLPTSSSMEYSPSVREITVQFPVEIDNLLGLIFWKLSGRTINRTQDPKN